MDKPSSELLAPAGNRRNFVRNLGLASAAAGIVGSSQLAEAQSSGPSDIDILNFALNLEYLEAEFYTVATTGKTIDNFGVATFGSGTAGPTTGGSMVPFSFSDGTVKRVAQELAANERFHVALLQNTITLLGGTPIAKPAINLNALGLGFGNQNDFLVASRAFEEIGVTAYGGAAALITNKTVLSYAARILATEAEHVGFIRSLIGKYGIATAPLDGVDIAPLPSGPQYFSLNTYSVTGVRTPGQVLFLAFGGGANATAGGFFPSGVNGLLNTSSATAATTDAPVLTLTPNPAPASGGYATVTVTWNAPSPVQYIQIRISSPSGPLFTTNLPSGSMVTGNWVQDGMIFYLQDVSYPKGNQLTAVNTLATAIARIQGLP